MTSISCFGLIRTLAIATPKKKVCNFVGGVLSPILANIYLHELDCYVEALIADFTKGEVRSVNREWKKISSKASRLNKEIKQEVDQEARSKLLEHKKDLLR